MGLSESGINEENHIVSGIWIAWLIDDSISTILFVSFCPYHFVPCHFVLEPSKPIAYRVLDVELGAQIGERGFRVCNSSILLVSVNLP